MYGRACLVPARAVYGAGWPVFYGAAGSDRLTRGQLLRPGQMLRSPNGAYRLVLQTDGNLVLYNAQNVALWDAHTQGKPSSHLLVQNDGNVVLYSATGPLWHAGTQGHPGTFLVLQDDGNLVVYLGTQPLWNSGTWGGARAGSHDGTSFLQDVGHVVSSLPGAALHAVEGVGKAAVTAVTAVPRLIGDIAQGERVDRALVDSFKRQLGAVREVAPYVETIVSFVPGIGSGAAAALAGSVALASGQPISAAIVAAARAAIPGGPAGQAAFDLAVGMVQGKSITASALDALLNRLPPEARKAAQIGAAIANGINLQKGLVATAVADAAKVGIQAGQAAHLPAAIAFHTNTMLGNLSKVSAALASGRPELAAAHAATAKAHELAAFAAKVAAALHLSAAQVAPKVVQAASHVVKAVELHHAPSQAFTRQLATRPDPAAKVELALLDIARKGLRAA